MHRWYHAARSVNIDMKKKLLALLLCAVLALTAASAAFAATSEENKTEIMTALGKTVLSSYAGILNQIQKILNQDSLTVTDEQKAELLALTVSNESLTFVNRGTNLNDYTAEEKAVAVDMIDKVADILGLTYKIEDTNDKQSNTGFVLSVYQNGKLLGKINSDAKTDVDGTPRYWYLIVGAVLLAVAAIVPFACRKKVAAGEAGAEHPGSEG